MLWPRICPVCRQELPERGNRRVYVPWKRGYRLVHAGECFELIDSQGVLELDRKPAPTSPVLRVQLRKYTERLRYLYEPLQCTREQLASLAGLHEPFRDLELVGEDTDQQFECSRERLLELRNRVFDHGREVSGQARTELFA